MTVPFQVIGIISRMDNAGVCETVKSLISYLSHQQRDIIVDQETAKLIGHPAPSSVPKEELASQCHLIIVVGGDGSLLHAAHTALHSEVPILGINRGRLGFLTDIRPSELEKIGAILQGQYLLEKRFLLTATIEHQHRCIGQSNALNEVALIPDSIPHLNELEIYIDDQFVCSQASDGIIVATPTGSTAYALSGGGPILHPQLDAIVLVPMFPHTLSLRPLVIDGNHRITLVITPHNTATPRLTCDGQSYISTPPGSHVTIQKNPQHLHLVHPLDYDYYAALRSKLHWGRKLQYTDE